MKRKIIGLLLLAMGTVFMGCSAGGGSAATSTWTFGIIDDTGAATSLVTISNSQPLVLEVYDIAAPATIVGTLKFTDKTQVQSIEGLTPGATYIAIGYSDQDNDGLDLGDWLGPVEAVQNIAEGETHQTYYPWLSNNIGPQRAITDLSFVHQFAFVQWTYDGTSPFTGNHVTTVITSNHGDVRVHASWFYFPNGGASTGGMMLVNGLDPSATYGLFVYDDTINPYQGTLESGEDYYWPLSGGFPSLPAGQRFQAHDLTQALASPAVMSSGATVATY
jgi:hypothetical protein